MHGFSCHSTQADGTQFRRTDEQMKAQLLDHENRCFIHSGQRIEYPEPRTPGATLKFEHIKNQLQAPFTVYADFESILEQVDVNNKIQEHTACSYAYHITSTIPNVKFDPRLYLGENAIDHFLSSIQEDFDKYIMPVIKAIVPINWTNEDQERFESATHCHICKEELSIDDDELLSDTVRDHDHFTGEFRGAAHSNCNLQYKICPESYQLPIIFHNLRGYDAHLIFQKVKQTHGRISVIPNNSERYVSFRIGCLKFIDSLQFLSSSLDNLAGLLAASQFIHLKSHFPYNWQLLSRKGVYCYDYMDSMERFNETSLPSIESFYSKLYDQHISEREYEHAEDVWCAMDCENIGHYHNIYLLTDVLLLADVFENFRKMSLETYGLDPVHYCSLPGLSWDAMLKYTNVHLDLITDPDMYQMVEDNIRGGISNISHRHAIANIDEIDIPNPESYNADEPITHLTYLDANALYSWAMSQMLPHKTFKWVSTDIDILNVPVDGNIGYILEVDLEYPSELHDTHNDYPLAPEHVNVTDSMLSPFQKEHFPSIRTPQRKLIPNLHNKTKYVVHYRNLQLYTSLGMKITQIHRVIQFEQSCWMKSYIELNTSLRQAATIRGDSAGKDMFKLFNNAVFGKTMENLRKRIDFELVTSKKIALKRIAKPSFQRAKRFNEDLVGIHCAKQKLVLNRPIQAGFAILDLSKLHMYNFHYNVWMKHFPNSTLLFTDTDSLAYKVVDDDLYGGMAEIKQHFDFSEYPKSHVLYSRDNMKVIGKFKDECKGQHMLRFAGLRPKLYSFDFLREAHFIADKYGDIVELDAPNVCGWTEIIECSKATARGVKKNIAKKLTTVDYKYCIDSLLPKRVIHKRIGSDHHNIYTYSSHKVGLSAFDNKRWICEDGITTYAFGHYRNSVQSTS